MIQAIKRFWNNQKGVTLIELLAVVVILGVVAAIAAPSVLTNFNEAKVNADAQTQAIIEDAAKRMVMDAARVMPIESIDRDKTESIEFVYLGGPEENDKIKLSNYLDAKFKGGTIPSVEDKNKLFYLEIIDGKVTVTIE